MALATLSTIGGVMAGAGQLASGLGFGGGDFSRKEYRDQLKIQNKVMREQLPLNIAAYKDAGIHPLIGLGAQPNFSAQPTSSSGVDLSQMGQGIQRAAAAYMTREERDQQKLLDALTLEEAAAKVDLLKAQATNIRAATTPAFPGVVDTSQMPGQGDARASLNDLVQQVASQAISGASGRPGVEAGVSPAVKAYQTGSGRIYAPSEELGESLEGLGAVAGTVAGVDVLLRAILPQYMRDLKAWKLRQHPIKAIREFLDRAYAHGRFPDIFAD